MSAPIFSAEFQQRLKLDKYTQWAHDLTEEHLNGILGLVREFSGRAHCLLDLFEQHPEVCSPSLADSYHVRMQLECVLQITAMGDRFDAVDAKRRFEQGRSCMQISDLPDLMKSNITKAAPDVKWSHVSMSEYGYELSGKNESGTQCDARVNYDGKFIFMTSLFGDAIPDPVSVALRMNFPDYQLLNCYGVSTQTNRFDSYELRVSPQFDNVEPQHIDVSADGGGVEPTRRDGRRAPLFSQAFQNSMGNGSYARWAAKFSEASMEGLLWILGTVATETLPLLKSVDSYVDLSPWPDDNVLRPRFALDGIFRFVVHGEHFNHGQMLDVCQSMWQQWFRACHKAIPINVKNTVKKALEKTKCTFSRCYKSVEEFTISGKDEAGRDFWVSVGHDDGRVMVTRYMSEEEVPEIILAALKARLPKYRSFLDLCVQGPAWGIVDRYIFSVILRNDDIRRIVISADGATI